VRSFRPSAIAIGILSVGLLLCACSREREPFPPKREIVIGLNPSEKSESVQRNAEILSEMISRKIGLPVRIAVAHDYSGLVEAMRGRSVDFAFFPPLAYVFAERLANARVLLKAERNGRPYYYGCIVVHADSSYRTLADLQGHDIAWVDPTSTSGHIFPKAALVESGIDPDRFFRQQRFAGGHDAVLLAVANGTIAAGATFANDTLGLDGSWTQLGDGMFARKIRPIFYSSPIPGDNLATTQYMIDGYPALVASVTDAVQGLTADSAGKALMQRMYHVDAMVPATSPDYDPVRRAATLLHLDITGKAGAGDERNGTISAIFFIVAAVVGIVALVVQSRRARRRFRPLRTDAANDASSRPVDRNAQYSIRDLSVVYRDSEGKAFTALHDVAIDIGAGEFVAVIGLSGAGKSTLLRCLNRMADVSAGTILFEGEDIARATGRRLIELRGRIGFIFQQFNLVKNLSVMRNVLAGRLAHVSRWRSLLGLFPSADVEIARRYLEEVGLGDKMYARAGNLSGGQQQRVAIARALAQEPRVILADEPMASLDPKLAEVILRLLQRFNRRDGITVVVNLHVLELARQYADRIVALRQGRIVFDGTPGELTPEVVEEIYRTDAGMIERM